MRINTRLVVLRERRHAVLIVAFIFAIFSTLIAPPAASQSPEIDVTTAAVVVIKKSLMGRFVFLKPHFDSGAIGLTIDGLVAMRDLQAIALTQTLKVENFIADENMDRATLYREIARANGHPDWESNIKAVFGERWISRAPAGWYYRDSAGKWIRKM
jgi:uncharacterized protein YdbL (DUF1318 family)